MVNRSGRTQHERDEYTVCAHCRYIIRQDEDGAWIHNGTERIACESLEGLPPVMATPLYRTRGS
jgi:hypothetical protein